MITKEKFAMIYAQESLFYDLCKNSNWPKKLTDEFRKFSEKVQNSLKEITNPFNVIINGYEESEDISLYDIDESLRKEFGDKIRIDSPSGYIGCFCNEKYKNRISEFLKSNYTTLKLSIDQDDILENPWFSNWSSAIKYCEENNIKVELPKVVNIDETKLNKLKQIESSMSKLEKEKQEILSKL